MTGDGKSAASLATRRRARLRMRLAITLGLLVELVEVASVGKSRYSLYSARMIAGHAVPDTSATPDICPLPLADLTWPTFPLARNSICGPALCTLVKASPAGLNYLYANFKLAEPPSRCTNGQ